MSAILQGLETLQRTGLLQEAGLLDEEHGVAILVNKMATVRTGIMLAKRDGYPISEAHVRKMLLGLRYLWGMAGGVMAFGDHNEGCEVWAPQAADQWAMLATKMGHAVELAEWYIDCEASGRTKNFVPYDKIGQQETRHGDAG